MKRLIGRWTKSGRLRTDCSTRHRFPIRYTNRDIELLARADVAHSTLAGPATKAILAREFTTFHRAEYERLAGISVSHLYRLRLTERYRFRAKTFHSTSPAKVTIGERHKPIPNGQPGFVRVDSVHQGDGPNGQKGVYTINLVDEVTQWEVVAAVPAISEQFLLPVLALLLEQCPFRVVEFHSDNGSEFINHRVADLLKRLQIKLSKSRARRHNDNALVEGKNGSVIRKHMGYSYINGAQAAMINHWYADWLNPYLNFHRPCAFPKVKLNAKGKETRTYPLESYQTPYEKLKSLPATETWLKPDSPFAKLDQVAYSKSDTEWAEQMMNAKGRLFRHLSAVNQPHLTLVPLVTD